MSWRDISLFLHGSAAVLLDALLGPLYRHLHRKSFKN